MKAPKFRMLVVDDQIGRTHEHRESFLARTGRPAEDFIFCTGQSRSGHNQVELVIDQVRSLWQDSQDSRLSMVLLDVRFDDEDDEEGGRAFGFKLLCELRDRFGRDLPIVMLTSVMEVREKSNAAKADGFLPKDTLDSNQLEVQLRRNGLYPETTNGVYGTARTFLLTLREVRRAIEGGVKEVLVLGESGTGKSAFAEFIHRASQRDGRFESWFGRRANAELHYSQLFGHWKGAFDGAKTHHAGLAERAHKGTLFLDEIAELGSATQTDFLEYRQRKQDGFRRIRRMGSTPTVVRQGKSSRAESDIVGVYREDEDRILVDTLIVAATNQPIEDERWRTEHGFRDDLFNRFATRVRLPPLRERKEDVVPLFVKLTEQAARRSIALAYDARDVLIAHEWCEGNIQELKNLADAAVARLGPDFSELHAHHMDGLIRLKPRDEDVERTEPRPFRAIAIDSSPPIGDANSSFVHIELQRLRELTECLRTAAIASCGLTRAGTLQEILKRATNVNYSPMNAKRELKEILKGWFKPNDRQRARWASNPLYVAQVEKFQSDKIVSSLYAYSVGRITKTFFDEEIIKEIHGPSQGQVQP